MTNPAMHTMTRNARRKAQIYTYWRCYLLPSRSTTTEADAGKHDIRLRREEISRLRDLKASRRGPESSQPLDSALDSWNILRACCFPLRDTCLLYLGQNQGIALSLPASLAYRRHKVRGLAIIGTY